MTLIIHRTYIRDPRSKTHPREAKKHGVELHVGRDSRERIIDRAFTKRDSADGFSDGGCKSIVLPISRRSFVRLFAHSSRLLSGVIRSRDYS